MEAEAGAENRNHTSSEDLRSEIGRYLREDLNGGGGGGGVGGGGGGGIGGGEICGRGKAATCADDFDLDSLEASIEDITNMYGR